MQGAFISGVEGYQKELEVLLNLRYSYTINEITPIVYQGASKLVIDVTVMRK
ncbi:ADP-ribosyltransferase [Bacillus sp. FSL K6-0268]|uniref:ADP-ribosyltransferase n=1 Tax=Bacillus sp. FSL K6-0268 TaxID=2921449 RepID=UPI0040469BEB